MWPSPKLLCGQRITLVPLSHRHEDGLTLASVAKRHIPIGCRVPPAHDLDGEISTALERQADGLCLPFAVQTPDEHILGMTGFDMIDRANKRLRIGGTWLKPLPTQQFSEMMVMLLTFGFEIAGAQTIQAQAPANAKEHRQMIEDLGAKLDGILRGERLNPDGTAQDVAAYSIIQTEWPQTRDALLARLF